MKRTNARILLCVLLCISMISASALPLFAEQQAETSISTQGGKSLDFPAYDTDDPPTDGYFDWNLDRIQPAVAYSPIEDRYLLVYQNSGPDLEDDGIMGQFITSDAAVFGDPVPICVRQDTSYNLKLYPDIAYGDGLYVIVWVDATFTNYKVLGKIITSDGSFATDVITIDETNSYICENSLSVTYGEGGSFLVAWSDNNNVIGRMINPRADDLSDRIPISTGNEFFRYPSVAYSEASDKFFVAWDDNRVSDSDCNIYGKFVGVDGSPETGEISICTAEHNQLTPSVTYDSSNQEFLLTWVDETGEDSEAVNYGIYGNYFDSNGNPQLAGGGESFAEGSSALSYLTPAIEYNRIRAEYLPIWANIPYSLGDQVAPYCSGQQLDKSLEAAGDRLTFGNGIYNWPSPKPAIASSTLQGKYLVVYPCENADRSKDISVYYLKWELIGEDAAASPGKLQFELENNYADEGAGTARIKVLRTEGLDGQVKVFYATKDYAYPGVASPGSDYISVTGILTFESGETEKTFDVTIKDDLDMEGTEPIVFELSQPTGGAVLGSMTLANLFINDNDSPSVSLGSSSYTVSEDVNEQYIDIPVVFSGFPIMSAAYVEGNGNEAAVFSVVYETMAELRRQVRITRQSQAPWNLAGKAVKKPSVYQ
ncbi:MAG TPA: Calx-beta domain-containing protein [Negativicutes bacterium]|nr:Calx-beta domain-containing protein [Negativicutes bacterium]